MQVQALRATVTATVRVGRCVAEAVVSSFPLGKYTREQWNTGAMASIESLLHRRTDLSTFVVHFTRDGQYGRARDNLISILANRKIEARTAYGMARHLAGMAGTIDSPQQVVCFSETPLEHAWMMCADIDGRSVSMSSYGVAFTKTFARRRGANPVWYIDQTPGHDWLTQPIDKLIAKIENGSATAEELGILDIAPFMEQMGGVKEFWWEREWRHVGDMSFGVDDVVVIFAPESQHDYMRRVLHGTPRWRSQNPRIVDPGWGLERMIGALSEISDVGPFPR